MSRFFVAMALACALASSALAARGHRVFCAPVYIEGAGTVRICASARGR